jgi:peptidoglycan/xylan/chitin deacetylase (PgdA/CDA1 family)
MSDDDFKKTLFEESNAIYQMVQKYPKFLRLPSDGYTDNHVSIASSMGFVVTTWNIDSDDYTATELSSMQAKYEAAFKDVAAGKSRFISLHHDGAPVYGDTSVIPALADYVKANLYSFVPLDKCLGLTSAYRATNDNPGVGTSSTNDASIIQPILSMFASVAALFQ